MRWFRYFNISAVFPNGLSLTTARLPSRTASAPTPGSRQVMLLWPLTTVLKRYSAIRHPANEKGLVEGLVGYIRRNVCVPVPKAESMEDLNRMLQEKCLNYLSHQIRGKESSVGEMLTKEREKLYPLPGYPFDPCKRVTGRVDRFCTVRFDTNNYSVPAAYCGREVSVKAGPEMPSFFASD